MAETTETPPVERFFASEEDLSALLVGAGLTPGNRSPLAPPVAESAAEPSAAQLAALTVLANPVGTLRLVGPASVRGTGMTTSLYWATRHGPFVILTEADHGADITVLPTRPVALTWLDSVLSLTSLPSPFATDRWELDLPGYAAMLALADAVSEVRLRERLDRRQVAVDALSIPDLQQALDAGLAANDDRWAVSGTRAVSPVDLTKAASALESGVAALSSLGIVATTDAGIGITQEGAEVVSALSSGPLTTAISTATGTGDDVEVVHLTLHRSPIAIHVAVWQELGDTPSLILHQPSAHSLLDLIEGLITGG